MAKSLYRSRAGRHFYGKEDEIWTGFGTVVQPTNRVGTLGYTANVYRHTTDKLMFISVISTVK